MSINIMAPQNDEAPRDEASSAQNEARLFYERLEQAGQLVNVGDNADVSALPAHVTHIRYSNGTVKRIRFATSPYRQT
jgi:hypothetical protein